MKNLISNKNKVVIHVITSLTDHGAQKNLLLFIKKIKVKGFKKHIVISIKKPNKYSNVYYQLKKLDIPVYKLKIKNLFINTDTIKLASKEKQIIFFGWMYHGMLVAFLMSKLCGHNNKLIWTIRHGEPFHKGINIITKLIIITLSLISKCARIPILINSYCGIKNHIKIGFSREQIKFWPNFVNNKRAHYLKLPFKNKKEYILLYPARYHPQKNHDMTIKVLENLLDKYNLPTKLILVGENIDLYKSHLLKKLNMNNLLMNSIEFINQTKNIKEYYKTSDIIISTSSFGEGLQNIILEGLYFGKLVFSTKAGDASKILSKEFLCKKNDHKIMSKQIANTINNINNEPKYKEKLIQNHINQIKRIDEICDSDFILETFINNIK